ncbi:MAG: hypothetical protein KAR33_09275 [Candidatus Thorarchaeota archaeon]|nr:hypothetical protein [Candidatus Thorarchaeota archaeon]
MNHDHRDAEFFRNWLRHRYNYFTVLAIVAIMIAIIGIVSILYIYVTTGSNILFPSCFELEWASSIS